MDDTWVKIRTREGEAFTEHSNAVDNNIKFIQEDVRGDSLPFLDCAVHIEEGRHFNIELYRKPTHRSILDSHHPLAHELGFIRTLNHWAETMLTQKEGKENEQKHIRGPLKKCCYPNWTFVKTSARSEQIRRRRKNVTTSSLLMLQEYLRNSGGFSINTEENPRNKQINVVDAVQCRQDCTDLYIGD